MKVRIDKLLVMNGYFDSREAAKRALMAGEILIDDIVIDKAGMNVDIDSNIRVKSHKSKYVSRGGYKLEKAISNFHIDLQQKACMDVGASTGGFSDCMLQNGAKCVYAVDVGYGQLDYKIREDKRIYVYERTNARELEKIPFEHLIDFCSVDVSFISLKLVLAPILSKLAPRAQIVTLIKPQFEAGREKVGKGGVVREQKVHVDVIESVILFAQSLGLSLLNLDFSPITGPNGNIEFLAHFERAKQLDASEHSVSEHDELFEHSALTKHDIGEQNTEENNLKKRIKEVVEAAHEKLRS